MRKPKSVDLRKTSNIDLRPLDAWNFLLLTDIHYYYIKGKKHIHVPKGFITDLATIPRFAWWCISRTELSYKAPIVHDYLYEKRQGTQKEADQIFLQIMIEERISFWRRNLAYFFVRMLGWIKWYT